VIEEVSIDPRFCGPPGVANGGYVAGLLAACLRGAVLVRLRAPAPLGASLRRVATDDGVALERDGRRLAEARRTTLSLEVPAPPSPDALLAREGSCRAMRTHPFPRCFVCGPERAEGDGLRIFPGWHPGARGAAAPWRPAADLADASGLVRPEFVWAALDCTSAFPLLEDPENQRLEPLVLARIEAHTVQPTRAGALHAVSAWILELDAGGGTTAVALHDEEGSLHAVGRARWVSLAGRSPLQSS
jgi:hypothetical protein